MFKKLYSRQFRSKLPRVKKVFFFLTLKLFLWGVIPACLSSGFTDTRSSQRRTQPWNSQKMSWSQVSVYHLGVPGKVLRGSHQVESLALGDDGESFCEKQSRFSLTKRSKGRTPSGSYVKEKYFCCMMNKMVKQSTTYKLYGSLGYIWVS